MNVYAIVARDILFWAIFTGVLGWFAYLLIRGTWKALKWLDEAAKDISEE